MQPPSAPLRLLWTFVLLLLGLSVPFWILGARTQLFLAPGLPVSATMAVCPLIAAITTTAWHDRLNVGVLLRGPLDYSSIPGPRWIVLALTLKPGIMMLAGVLMRAAQIRLPVTHYDITTVAGVCVVFFVAAVAEETGWTGLATHDMLSTHGPLPVALSIGGLWAAWHLIPLRQADRSATWIAWHAVETIASRALIVWLYVWSRRCVSLAVLYHAADNVSWLLFPEWGSYYAPALTGPLTALAAASAFAAWPPKTFAAANAPPLC